MLIQNQILRGAIFILGIVSLALGLVGAFLPVLPTTPFLLLAAWCFLKTSPKAHAWLYRQPMIGQALRDWEERGAISTRSKTLALSMIAISLIVIWLRPIMMPVRIGVTIILVAVSVFILTRPSR